MRRRTFLLASGALAWSLRAAGQPSELWAALREGGVAILLRHAQTEPGVGDPAGFRLSDCSTQRNLSDEGRAQARRIAATLAARGVRVDRVLSSRWCRCLETARLAFPDRVVEPFAALDSFFEDRSSEPGRTRDVTARIQAIRPPANVVFVTHHVNILALTGEAVGSGEAVLVQPAQAVGGAPRRLGRLLL